jgi:hypothetical protein
VKIPTQRHYVRTEVREGTPIAVLYRDSPCTVEAGQITHDEWEELGSPRLVDVEMNIKPVEPEAG